jgi:NAD(P) transhydrogenase
MSAEPRSGSKVRVLASAVMGPLRGVHIIGDGASELIHIGQAVLAFGGTIDYFINTVFNYPTLAECYKVAAFDGINRIGVFHEADAPGPPPAA